VVNVANNPSILSVVKLSVVMLSVVMMSVVAPLTMIARDKHSSLFPQGISKEGKNVKNIRGRSRDHNTTQGILKGEVSLYC
jgi:hypothetical protein